jgi:DnaJ-class molecular chaperone
MCGGYGYWGARDETCPSCRGSGHVDEAPAERPFDPVEADCEIQEDVDDDTDDIF